MWKFKRIKEIKGDVNLLLFNMPGIGIKELKLSNKIMEALEEYEKSIISN